jgi:hypothetical protein
MSRASGGRDRTAGGIARWPPGRSVLAMMLIYVTVGVGLAVSDETGLDWLVTRAHRAVRQIGVFGGVHVGRWQDDSGATLILGRRSGELLDFIPVYTATSYWPGH